MSRPPRWSLLVFAIGPIVGLIAIVFAAAGTEIPPVILTTAAGAWVAAIYWTISISRADAGDRTIADGFSDGDSVEVDCRLCGQFNRVPATRLRDRPMCGRCKTRLMPGKRITICRTARIEGALRVEFDALWTDDSRLWSRLADHLAIKQRTEEERRRAMAN